MAPILQKQMFYFYPGYDSITCWHRQWITKNADPHCGAILCKLVGYGKLERGSVTINLICSCETLLVMRDDMGDEIREIASVVLILLVTRLLVPGLPVNLVLRLPILLRAVVI